jgi:DNA recombination protein RmuC
MGFLTLAIEKRSSEVWALLGTVKTQFAKFGDLLEGVQKKLQEASNKMDDVARKSRTIERKLRVVQELPSAESARLLGAPSGAGDASEPDESDEENDRA